MICFYFSGVFRRKVHQVLVNATIRHIRCVADVAVHLITFRNHFVHNAAIQQPNVAHVSIKSNLTWIGDVWRKEWPEKWKLIGFDHFQLQITGPKRQSAGRLQELVVAGIWKWCAVVSVMGSVKVDKPNQSNPNQKHKLNPQTIIPQHCCYYRMKSICNSNKI